MTITTTPRAIGWTRLACECGMAVTVPNEDVARTISGHARLAHKEG